MRQQKTPPPPVIDPRAVFTRLQATALLGLQPSTLATEIRKGRLRVSRRAGRYFILGAWLLQWIRAGERKRPSRGGANGVQGGATNFVEPFSPRGENGEPGRADE
jgi:hypothetical protein